MNGRTRAEALREAFDLSFAAAPAAARVAPEKLLRVRVGDAPFAIRLSQIAGVHRGRRIVPCPSPVPELLGLAGIRGRAVPVYSLAALLGVRGEPGEKWIAIAGHTAPLGFAFDGLEGHVEAVAADFVASRDGDAGPHVREAVRAGSAVYAVLEMTSLIAACERRTGNDSKRS